MTDEENQLLSIFHQVHDAILAGKISFTEANKYLDSIDFPPEWRVPGVHINNEGETELYDWIDGTWKKQQHKE